MEWNAKSLGQWDWEHFFFMNGRATENPKLQLSTDWHGEADREVNIGALYPSGGSGCSVSELFHASSSRSSKSASNNSSSNGDSKLSMLTQEGSQDGSTAKKELPVETSPTAEPSAVSGEPLLTLKLGKRFYFEDVSNGSGSKKLTSSEVLLSSGKKGKSGQNLIPASCQVEGCGLDLSSAKDYHRKHRVCETHSKSPMVVIAGLERRFCQQCSRFHALPEFDDQKRSCRRRLADHNARRRKPQPEAVQMNPSALSSSHYGSNLTSGRQIMRPYAFPRNATNLAWHEHDIHSSSKLPQTKDFLLKPTKDFHKIPNTMLSDDSSGLLASKGIGTKTTFPGIQDPNDTQDVNRALSLLSTNSWDAYKTKTLSLQHSDRTNCITQTRTHTITQRLPLPSSEYWHTDHQPADPSTCVSYSDYDNSNRFQDLQLLNAPFESSFPCNQLD